MITIKIIIENTEFGDIAKPERMLTPEEEVTVTSSVSDSEKIIHYQGDEPKF